MRVEKSPLSVLLVLPLAYRDGRDKYAGFLRYVSEKRPDWNIRLERERLMPGQARAIMRDSPDAVVIDGTCGPEVASRLAAAPCCIALDTSDRRPFASVPARVSYANIDSAELGRAAAEYFLARPGLGSFAFVGYGEAVLWSGRRERAFRDRLTSAGRAASLLQVPYAGESSRATRKCLQKLLRCLPHPAAVFAACDRLARLVADVAREAGIAVPNEISVLGVDNEEIICTHTRPTLSSLQPDFTRLGYEAARTLDRMMTGNARESIGKHLDIGGARLIERESTAPPYSAAFLIAQVKEAILRGPDAPPRINDIARTLGVSRRLIDLRFREITGETVLDFIRREKLEKVKRLLAETDMPIGTICEDCSFRSVNHLKRIFKAQTGQSMRDWRLNRISAPDSCPTSAAQQEQGAKSVR